MAPSTGGAFVPALDQTVSGTWTFNGPVVTSGASTFASPTLTSPTLSGPVNDTNGLNRLILNPTAKALTSGSAVSLFNVARASGSWAGGSIRYTIEVTDGTDYQSLAGFVTYAFVDKAGTGTFTITELSTTQAKAVSSGTLTVAWTFVTGTGVGTVKVAPTTSLTATTLQVFYTVEPIVGAVTIL